MLDGMRGSFRYRNAVAVRALRCTAGLWWGPTPRRNRRAVGVYGYRAIGAVSRMQVQGGTSSGGGTGLQLPAPASGGD